MITIKSPVSRFLGSNRRKKSPAPVFCWQGGLWCGFSGAGGGHSGCGGGGGGHSGSGGRAGLGGGGGSGM